MTVSFDILPLDQVPRDGVLEALDRSLGPGHNSDWFTWKHIDNPFGNSLGWAAVGESGVLGVRLFMRWNLQADPSKVVRAVRPVDTATIPEARRHGVFRALTEHALEQVVARPDIDLIFNSPNASSRPGYAAMGWTILPPVSHGIKPLLPGKEDTMASDNLALAALARREPVGGRWSTAMDVEVARWRYDPRSGQRYCWARLSSADAANGIIYRTIHRTGLRLLVVYDLAAAARDRARLLSSVARKEGTRVALTVTGPGARDLVPGRLLRRGSSILAVRPLRDLAPDPADVAAWALTLGDLDRVI